MEGEIYTLTQRVMYLENANDEMKKHVEKIALERVKYLEQANDELKKHVEKIALEQSDAIAQSAKKKKPLSEENKIKWAYYHEHKDAVMKDMQKQGHLVVYWQAVKKTTDEMYARAKEQGTR
jgi:hypothetical protein